MPCHSYKVRPSCWTILALLGRLDTLRAARARETVAVGSAETVEALAVEAVDITVALLVGIFDTIRPSLGEYCMLVVTRTGAEMATGVSS